MATKRKTNQQDQVPALNADGTTTPQYPPFDLNKREANMVSRAIDEATTFLEQLRATLSDRRQRMKVSPKELAIVSAIVANFAPEQGWTQNEVNELSTAITSGGGASGDGKDIGTVPH